MLFKIDISVLRVLHTSYGVSEKKSSQISKNLLSILADFSNAVFRMVSILQLIS